MRRLQSRIGGALAISALATASGHLPLPGSSAATSLPTCSTFTTPRFESRRFVVGSTGPSAGAPPQQPASKAGKKLGTIHIGLKNFPTEIRQSDVPCLLFFHVETHPEVVKYTNLLMDQVELANKKFVLEKMGTDKTATPDGLERIALKLGLVDVEKEGPLAGRFGVAPDTFPLMYFIYKGEVLDRLVGMVPEAQIRDAITAFIAHVEEAEKQAALKPKEPSAQEKLNRMDNDDENVLTLLQAATVKIRDGDAQKAEFLYDKAYNLATQEVEKLKKSLGLHLKKPTPETEAKLKKDPHYNACPQALCGLALVALAMKNVPRAAEISKEIRTKYPWAPRELREVAETVSKIDLLSVTGYEVGKDGYQNLLRCEYTMSEPVTFYRMKLKLAVAHYLEQQYEYATDECLKLIRAEPKLYHDLKQAGLVGEKRDDTPARKALSLIIEGLGPNHDISVRARKKMAAFMSC